MKRVYIVIVNWNGSTDTIECLESLFRLNYQNYRVVVCDNGSTDGSLDRIMAWAEGRLEAHIGLQKPAHGHLTLPPVEKPLSYAFYDRQKAERGSEATQDPHLVLLRSDDNLGFAGGNNLGMRYALAADNLDYVWLLNNDTVVDPEALTSLVTRMSEKKSAGICGSTLVHYNSEDRIQARAGGWYCKWIGLPWHIGQCETTGTKPRVEHVEKWMNYVVGASMLVSRDFLVEVGLMCEDYFLYFEETDWARRGKGRFTLAYAPDSIVYHKVGRSIGTRSDPRHKSALSDYYSIRNRILFSRRFYPETLPTIYLSLCTAILSRLLAARFDLAATIWKLMLGRDVPPPGQEGRT